MGEKIGIIPSATKLPVNQANDVAGQERGLPVKPAVSVLQC